MKYRNRILAILMALAMILAQPLAVLAAPDSTAPSDAVVMTEAEADGESSPAEPAGEGDPSAVDPDLPGQTAGDEPAENPPADDPSELLPGTPSEGTAVTDQDEVSGIPQADEEDAAADNAAEGDEGDGKESEPGEKTGETEDKDETDETDTDVDLSAPWTASDFTFGDYEQRLYGCDYSRDFTVKGIAVTGFSEAGLKKLEVNTDLVLPSRDTEGHDLCGVAPNAFAEKGLTSVKFPTGMLIPYDDTVTHRVTRRGNFIIGESAFTKNKLTSVYLPDGVIAVLSNAFSRNDLTEVTLPKTIWWV